MSELRRHAHSLKGACGYVCSQQLRDSALKLQLACDELQGGDANEQQLASIGAAFERVQFEMELVLSAISDFVAAAKR